MIKEIQSIKKALFIENEDFLEGMKGTTIFSVYERLKELGIECKVIDHATQHKEEVFKESMCSDAIFFSSTFLRFDEVKSIGDLFSKIKEPKMIFGHVMAGRDLVVEIEDIWNLEELNSMSHHRVFEIHERFISEDDAITEIPMSVYSEHTKKEEAERIERNKGFKKTGFRVKILDLQANGKAFSNLRRDDVVDELDSSSIDPNPGRGIWVMGNGEPVKLLNSDGYNEWTYETLKSESLAKEFLSRGNRWNNRSSFNSLHAWINNCSGKHDLTHGDIWNWADEICVLAGVERRGNRNFFYTRLLEYRKQYNYFKEKSNVKIC